MDKIGLDGFNFERGIERIIRKQDNAPDLPREGGLAPAELVVRPQLEQLLRFPHLDEYLEELFMPELADRELLMPTRFRSALQRCQSALQSEAQVRPAAARTLNRAARVLAEEDRLQDLLAMYRNVLQRG